MEHSITNIPDPDSGPANKKRKKDTSGSSHKSGSARTEGELIHKGNGLLVISLGFIHGPLSIKFHFAGLHTGWIIKHISIQMSHLFYELYPLNVATH